MAELKYDPEFPYVVLFGDYVAARFPAGRNGKANAESYARASVGEMIDTTPKPKIPEDAQHITWGDGEVAYSRYVDGLWYGWIHTGISEDELLDWIGDDEVTVLVRKEDS